MKFWHLFTAWLRRDRTMSKAWMAAQQNDSRVEFHGVTISFPVEK